jgi:hypothetical protein
LEPLAVAHLSLWGTMMHSRGSLRWPPDGRELLAALRNRYSKPPAVYDIRRTWCTPLPRRAVDWGRPRGYRRRARPVPNRPTEMERVETSLRAVGLPMGDPIHRGRCQRSTNAARQSCQGGMSARRGFVGGEQQSSRFESKAHFAGQVWRQPGSADCKKSG